MKARKEGSCGDCGVTPGELHIQGCDVECCVLCGGQAISCGCVYAVNGMDRIRLDIEHPAIYKGGPTERMNDKLEAEEAKFGGRLPWTGIWPGVTECQEFGLWCREAKSEAERLPGEGCWVPCAADHPDARENLNRLSFVAAWDRNARRWVLSDSARERLARELADIEGANDKARARGRAARAKITSLNAPCACGSGRLFGDCHGGGV